MLKSFIKSKNIKKKFIEVASPLQKKNIISLKRLILLNVYPKHIKKLRLKMSLKKTKILRTKRLFRLKIRKNLKTLSRAFILKRPFVYHPTLRLKELNYKRNLRWKIRDFKPFYKKDFSKQIRKKHLIKKRNQVFFFIISNKINFVSFFKEFFFNLDISNFVISFNLKKISFLYYNVFFSFINIWFLLKNIINVYYILFSFEKQIKYLENNLNVLFYLLNYEKYLKSFLNFRIPKITTRIKEFILKLRITHSNLFFTVLDSLNLNTLFHGSGGFYNSNKKIIERKLRLNVKRKKKFRRDIPNKLESKDANLDNNDDSENKKKVKKFVTKSKKHEKRKTKRLASIKKRKKWIRKTSNTSFDHLFTLILKTFKRYKYNQIRFWILSLNSLKYSFWKNMYKRWKPNKFQNKANMNTSRSNYFNKFNKFNKFNNGWRKKNFIISSSLWFQFKTAHNGMRCKKSRRL